MAEYIERDATIRELMDTYEREFPTADGAFDLFANRIIPRVIKNMPTVKMVHAKLNYDGWDEAWCEWGNCTNCGSSNMMNANYCSWCGAKIDGVKK